MELRELGMAERSTQPKSTDSTARFRFHRGLLAQLGVVGAFSSYPFLIFVSDNRGAGIGIGEVIHFPAALALLGSSAVLIAWQARGSSGADRTTVAFAAAIFASFNYDNLTIALEPLDLSVRALVATWSVLTTMIVVAAVILATRRATMAYVLIVGTALTVLPALQLGTFHATNAKADPLDGSADAGRAFKRRPDIYYFMPDAYARADQLREQVGFDNEDFLAELRGRGFSVNDTAYASYPLTYVSVPSVLEMDYMAEPGNNVLVSRDRFYEVLRGDSALVNRLRGEGYAHVQAPPGTWGGSKCDGSEDLCVDPIAEGVLGARLGEVHWSLLDLTPAATLLERFFSEELIHPIADPSHVVRTIEAAELDRPVFAFVHMLQTHPPFHVDAHCQSVEGSQDLTEWSEESKPNYVDTVRCVNRQLLAAIDVIDPAAVVVIQSDHGTEYDIPWDDLSSWDDNVIEQRLSVLSAVRLPRGCRELVQPPPSGVNTFRLVVACLEARTPDLLPQRNFIASYRSEQVIELAPR